MKPARAVSRLLRWCSARVPPLGLRLCALILLALLAASLAWWLVTAPPPPPPPAGGWT